MWTKPNLRTKEEQQRAVQQVKEALEGEGLQVWYFRGSALDLRVTVEGETFVVYWSTWHNALVLEGQRPYAEGIEEREVQYRYGSKAKTLAALLRKRAAARPAQRAAYAKERERDQKRREQAAQQQEREQKAKETLQALVTGVTVLGVEERWDGLKVTLVFANLEEAEAVLESHR